MKAIESLTVGQILQRNAEAVPQKTALVCGEVRKTYGELDAETDALAAGLVQLGVRKGDRIAIYMKSSVEFVTAFYALQKLGAVVAWINPMYRKTEAAFILRNSGARGVFIFDRWEGYDYLNAVSELKDELDELEWILLAGSGQGQGVVPWRELMARGTGRPYAAPAIDNKNDLAMFIYTSGTTGPPKGAMITHYQSVRAGWEYSLGTQADARDIFIGVLPMSHSYGCGALLIQPFLLQARLVLMEKFEAEAAFRLIEKEKVTLQLSAPVHYILELNHPRRSRYDLSSLRAGLIAGQPAPEGLITRVEKEMNVYLTSFWGASEVGPGVGLMCPYPSPLEVREKYVGVAVRGTQARVMDPLSRRELPDGEPGELAVSGWHVLKGYWQNPQETKKQIIDGWLFMGDLVAREANGYFKVFSRIKEQINRGGYKIIPYELESLIIAHPKVEQVCIVGTPNPVLGENICARVIPMNGATVTLDEIRDHLKDQVAPHKLPNELMMVEEFPRLSGGVKVKKFGAGGLAEMAASNPERERFRR